MSSSAKNGVFNYFVGAVSVGLLLFTSNVFAKITPSHVFQVADNISRELALFHQANGSKATISKSSLTKRYPRHVFQKGREVFLKAQQLREICGLNLNQIPAIPTQEVTPGNVLVMMENILVDVRELKDCFAVLDDISLAKFSKGKDPTEVYDQIAISGDSIAGLDIPGIVPNDVYQIMISINSILEGIQSHQNIRKKIKLQTGAKNKKPRDVYAEALRLFKMLDNLCKKNKNYCIKGGSIAPSQLMGSIKPADVLDLLNSVLADVVAVKIKLGDHSPTTLMPAVSGKTPSHLYDAVQTAQKIINTL